VSVLGANVLGAARVKMGMAIADRRVSFMVRGRDKRVLWEDLEGRQMRRDE